MIFSSDTPARNYYSNEPEKVFTWKKRKSSRGVRGWRFETNDGENFEIKSKSW